MATGSRRGGVTHRHRRIFLTAGLRQPLSVVVTAVVRNMRDALRIRYVRYGWLTPVAPGSVSMAAYNRHKSNFGLSNVAPPGERQCFEQRRLTERSPGSVGSAGLASNRRTVSDRRTRQGAAAVILLFESIGTGKTRAECVGHRQRWRKDESCDLPSKSEVNYAENSHR